MFCPWARYCERQSTQREPQNGVSEAMAVAVAIGADCLSIWVIFVVSYLVFSLFKRQLCLTAKLPSYSLQTPNSLPLSSLFLSSFIDHPQTVLPPTPFPKRNYPRECCSHPTVFSSSSLVLSLSLSILSPF